MAYQDVVTGSPFLPTYYVSVDNVLPAFDGASIRHALLVTSYRLLELEIWTCPLLPPIYLACLIGKARAGTLRFYDLLFPSFVAGFVLFGELGGNRYGPRYYFDVFPLMLVTIASGLPQVNVWLRGRCGRAIGFNAIVICVLYLVGSLPFASAAFHQQVTARQAPYLMVRHQGVENAVVILRQFDDMWLYDLVRNDADLRAPVLYARPGTSPHDLRKLFPDRSIWIFDGAHRGLPNRLSRLDQPAGYAPPPR
jgi:hypothetical protein